MWSLQGYAHMCITTHGYPSPISLDNKLRNLVLPPELYNSLYHPQPMAPPSADNFCKGEPPENNNNDNDDMIPAAAPGNSPATLCMRNFAATPMEQENETNWDSESDQFQPSGVSDQEEWGDDYRLDMGDFPSVADKPPNIEHGQMEGADGIAKVPTSDTHPPDPTHSSMPDSSPVADEDMGVPDPDCDENMREGEEPTQVDVVVKEEYKEELDYEDDEPTDEQPTDVSPYIAKCPGIWNQMGVPVDRHANTDTETGETTAMMENILGIWGPKGTQGMD